MSISNVNEQGSEWLAAFSKRPIFFMSRKEMDACFDANGVLRKSRLKNVELREDTCTLSSNDTYRRSNTTYEVCDKDKGSAFLDLNFLIKDETSSLKGSLSDKNDVDFYNFTIPFLRFQRNYFGVEAYIDMPEGCDYDLTLYDEYGNQVGKAEWDGEGRKKLSVPNWDMDTNKYCLKVENGNGEEVSPNDFYRSSFHVTDNKEHEKTDAVREAYGNLYSAYSRKDENWRDYLDRYNEVLRETEQNYRKDLEDRGVFREDIEGMRVRIRSNGDVAVDGIEDENIREQVQKLVGEKYSDKMYRYYIGTADSVGNLPENAYQYAADVQEVKRYLKGVTGQDVSLKNLYMLPDGNIGGLPGKADKLINHTKDNVKR